MDKYEIVVSGTGGQGVLLVGSVLDRAARFDGWTRVIGSEIHGMAQRGGSLVSYTRLGDDIHGPIVSIGSANVIISLEYIEGLRNIDRLSRNGYMVVAETKIPSSAMWVADTSYPDRDEILSSMQHVTNNVLVLDAGKIAAGVGNIRAANMVMLGAVAAAVDGFPISPESLKMAIEIVFPKKLIDVNIKAFSEGMQALGPR